MEGNIHEQNVPVMAYHQIEIGDGRWLDLVKESMRDVVTGAKGTARTAFQGAEYIAAGKTGTAQVKSLGEEEEYDAETLAEKFHDNALFIGYAPYENPKIAIAVVMENAGGGGSNAAPIARKLMDYYLIEQYLIEQHQESEQTTETEVVNNGSAQ